MNAEVNNYFQYKDTAASWTTWVHTSSVACPAACVCVGACECMWVHVSPSLWINPDGKVQYEVRWKQLLLFECLFGCEDSDENQKSVLCVYLRLRTPITSSSPSSPVQTRRWECEATEEQPPNCERLLLTSVNTRPDSKDRTANES